MPPAFKPAYLIHGDDHGRLAERRARLRELAERESGAQGLELFEGDGARPDAVAAALNAMTFAIGRRFLIVDGAESWKDKEMDALEAALAALAPDTTVTFFAREDGRLKAPARLHEAVRKAGGDVSAEQAVKPWDLPKWAVAQARRLGLDLSPDAARALVAHVGERQQRLLRELEKLALDLAPAPAGAVAPAAALPSAPASAGAPASSAGAPAPAGAVAVDVDQVLELSAASAQRRAWALADALLSGDAAVATRTLLQMRAQGERLPGLIYWMSTRVRQALRVARALERGEPQAQVKRGLRMPPQAADRLIADARRMGVERLERAIGLMADLEVSSRGGAGVRGGLGAAGAAGAASAPSAVGAPAGASAASDDTNALLAIRAVTAA